MAPRLQSNGGFAAALGATLYLLAGVAYLARPEPPEPLGNGLSPRVKIAAYALLLGWFVLLCLNRLDVFPVLYFRTEIETLGPLRLVRLVEPEAGACEGTPTLPGGPR